MPVVLEYISNHLIRTLLSCISFPIIKEDHHAIMEFYYIKYVVMSSMCEQSFILNFIYQECNSKKLPSIYLTSFFW